MNKKIILLNIFFSTSLLMAREQEINPELLVAAAHNKERTIQKLIDDQGVDVNTRNEKGWTALIVASDLGKESAARILLKNGANPDIAIIGDPSACTEQENPDVPVMCADIMPGAKLPFMMHKGWTALHFAADKGNEKIATLLLKNEATADSKDGLKRTPLMLAARGGHTPVVSLLIRRGASVNEKDKNDKSVLYYAVAYADQTGNKGIATIKELINNGALVDDEIVMTAEKRKDHKKIMQALTDRPSKGITGLVQGV